MSMCDSLNYNLLLLRQYGGSLVFVCPINDCQSVILLFKLTNEIFEKGKVLIEPIIPQEEKSLALKLTVDPKEGRKPVEIITCIL